MPSASRPSRPQSAFEQLKSWILSGSLAPGQRLPVRDVARGMNSSTMPVREALVRLEETGLVTQEPRKGAVVTRLSLDDINDFYNLRQLIEPPSIQLGVERMTPERLARLHSTMAALESAVAESDLVTVLDLDEDLLSLIHAAVANKQLARVVRSTWARIRPYKLLFTATAQADAGVHIVGENARLLEATEAGDGAGAHALMLNSLANAHLRLVDLLRSHDAEHTSTSLGESIANGESLATAIARLAEASQSKTADDAAQHNKHFPMRHPR